MMNNIDYFRAAKYGLMIHFGLYSLLGGEYKGKAGPNYAEWIQAYLRIPNHEMEKLASIFNPVCFNAEDIVTLAKDCGMKYIVITAKHHDGFALFKSTTDSFNTYDATPYKKDIIGDLSKSCKEQGIRFGFYYSQCIDWHEQHGGGYNVDPKGAAGVSWDNSWDYQDSSIKNYNIAFKHKIIPQIEELVTSYGDIFVAWFDMPLDSTTEQSRIIYELVKKHQPDCLINSRLGNGIYDYVSLGDNEIPDNIPLLIDESNNMNNINGFKPSPYGLYESACTLNKSWGYSAIDQHWKSPEVILSNRIKLERLGINYLINVGPDWLGRIPHAAQDILRTVQILYQKKMNQ